MDFKSSILALQAAINETTLKRSLNALLQEKVRVSDYQAAYSALLTYSQSIRDKRETSVQILIEKCKAALIYRVNLSLGVEKPLKMHVPRWKRFLFRFFIVPGSVSALLIGASGIYELGVTAAEILGLPFVAGPIGFALLALSLALGFFSVWIYHGFDLESIRAGLGISEKLSSILRYFHKEAVHLNQGLSHLLAHPKVANDKEVRHFYQTVAADLKNKAQLLQQDKMETKRSLWIKRGFSFIAAAIFFSGGLTLGHAIATGIILPLFLGITTGVLTAACPPIAFVIVIGLALFMGTCALVSYWNIERRKIVSLVDKLRGFPHRIVKAFQREEIIVSEKWNRVEVLRREAQSKEREALLLAKNTKVEIENQSLKQKIRALEGRKEEAPLEGEEPFFSQTV